MGLPLYHAPTESPAKSPPAAEKSPAQSRSLIRRRSRASNPEQVRERRRRILASTIDYSAYELRERSHYEGRSVRRPPPATEPDPDGPEMRRLYLARTLIAEREQREREERERAVRTGDEGLTFHHSGNVPPPAGGSEDREMMSSQAGLTPDPDQLPRPRLVTLPTGPYALSNLRSTQDPAYPNTLADHPRNAQRMHAAPAVPGRGPGANGPNVRRRDPRRELEELIHRFRPHIPWRQPSRQPSRQQSPIPAVVRDAMNRVDGLGDRNRSLSPEGDNVWDTLLSTVTPDPQPPSVGSSFASASASFSAAASQSAAAGSSGTPLTSPDVADDEPRLELVCESSSESDEDEDEGDNDGLMTFNQLMATVQNQQRRSYADVTRNTDSEDPLELLGGIGGMQHIVRGLARREDIPDEWWAEAGLSRTLPRDDSAN